MAISGRGSPLTTLAVPHPLGHLTLSSPRTPHYLLGLALRATPTYLSLCQPSHSCRTTLGHGTESSPSFGPWHRLPQYGGHTLTYTHTYTHLRSHLPQEVVIFRLGGSSGFKPQEPPAAEFSHCGCSLLCFFNFLGSEHWESTPPGFYLALHQPILWIGQAHSVCGPPFLSIKCRSSLGGLKCSLGTPLL